MQKESSKLKAFLANLLKYGIPVVFSVGLCYILFHDVDLSEMVDFVKSDCDFRYIFAAMGVGVLSFVFRAMRWRIQLKATGVQTPVMPAIYGIIGTYAVNLIFPRLGELWRAEYISRRQQAPFGMVLGTVVAERAADTVVVILLTGFTFLISGRILTDFIDSHFDGRNPVMEMISSPWTYVAIVALIAGVWALFHYGDKYPVVGKIKRMIKDLIGGFCSIFHMKGTGVWFIWTILLWGSYFVQMVICFEAFGLTRDYMAEHGVLIALVCWILASISMGLPTNGGIGVYQLAVAFGLQCFMPELPMDKAATFGTVVLGQQTLLVIVFGIASFIAIAATPRAQSYSQKGR